jgi:serine phosphatase RsbU (regulator of sigma subunit)
MRPLVSEGVRAGNTTPLGARLGAFVRTTWRGRVFAGAAAVWLVDLLLGLGGRGLPAVLAVPARAVLLLLAAWLAWRGLRWLSERLLWRIRTKLILSYLFIALVPVVRLGAFFAIAGSFFLMLSSSRLVRSEVDRVADISLAAAKGALVDLPEGEASAGASLRERLSPVLALQPAASWALLRRGRPALVQGEAPREAPAWWKGGDLASVVKVEDAGKGPDRALLRVLSARRDAVLVLDLPIDERFFAPLESRVGIHVLQPGEVDPAAAASPGVPAASPGGAAAPERGEGQSVRISRPWGLGFVALPRRNWQTGEATLGDIHPVLTSFQPLEFVRRLSPEIVGSWRSLSDIVLLLLAIVGLVFLGLYALALLMGLLLARSITHGVHALSLGTQRLRQGDFGHVIKVRSRDQLGELADSFNHMSLGLRQLMAEQAEKERLEEELRIARQIQMSLLPGEGLVKLAGVRVAALCLPAAEVGGDYYDLLPLGDTRLGVLVADVSGKGTSAALYMAELKGLVLSLSRIYDSPARLLIEANRILAANMDSRSFVTMTYAVVDTGARCMRYARAGHNPVLHFEAATGATHVLAPAGLGLGLDPGPRFEKILEERQLPLQPGDFFLFFTDGLSEAMNNGAELFGEGRLRGILGASEGLDSEALKQRILAEVRAFVGEAAQHDDMTLVVLKVEPQGRAA